MHWQVSSWLGPSMICWEVGHPQPFNSSCSGPFCCSESQKVCKNLLPAIKCLMFIKTSFSEWSVMVFPQHISERKQHFYKSTETISCTTAKHTNPCWSCAVDSNQTSFLCSRATRGAVAGSERPEGSLLLRVEWRDPGDIHGMAAWPAHLHERSGGLCHYEGTGTACTPCTECKLTAAATHNLLIQAPFLILSWNSSAPKFGICQKTSSAVRRHQKGNIFLVCPCEIPCEIPCLVKILIQKFCIKFLPLVSAK